MRRSITKVKTILKYIWSSSPGWTLLNAVFVLIRGVLPLLLLFLVKLLVDEIQVVALMPADQRSIHKLMWVLVAAGIIFLVNALSASVSILIRQKQSYVIADFFDNLVHRKTARLEYSYFEHPDYQDTFYRALNEASFRPSKVFYGVMGILQNQITLISMAIVLLSVHWSVLFVLLVITLPVVFIRLRHSARLFQFRKNNTKLERQVSYYNRLLTSPDFAKELRVFNLGTLFHKRYEEKKKNWRKTQFGMLKRKTRQEMSVQLLAATAFFFVYALIAKQAFNGVISIGEVVLYFMAMQRGYAYLQELLGRIAGLYEDSLFLDNLFEFINLKEVVKTPQSEALKVPFPKPIREGIRFEKVGFHYPSNERWILRDVSFSVKAGETVALVGANGTGKSTIMKLLCSLYSPQEGSITIDGVPIQTINEDEKVANISVIFQDFILYNVTARENIWFGDIRKKAGDDDIRQAAADAGIDKIISDFDQGYETTLGTLFEGSEHMSPGQWQRLALARSFFNDSQIILLDEPTSSLDAFSEAKLLKYIRSIIHGRTSFVISHRLSTIQMADTIVVLDGHKVVETGTYEELMLVEDGFFRKMVMSLYAY
ncbi:ABC transporter ATP-binding protein [Geofilum sp. OHC36d9]|uniref:ABC transporter ATP-binding protein n=1 Tax=Geofilum sp. OHC36d9 TaxID=3458413 RepID=UPI00403375F0